MKTSELIAAIGDENVTIQFLDSCLIRADMTKKGSKITFGSDVRLQLDKIEKSGMIVWMDRDQLKAVLAGPVAKQPYAEDEVIALKAELFRIAEIARDIVSENCRDITYDTDIRLQAEAILEIADKALAVKP